MFRHVAIVVIVAFGLIFGSACGAQPSTSERDTGAANQKSAPPVAAPPKPAEAAKPAAASAPTTAPRPAADAPAKAPPPADAGGTGGGAAAQPAIAAPLPVIPTDIRMVIYEATVNLEVMSMADTINQLTVIASDEGGYIATSDVQPAQNRGTVILKVRSDRFAVAMTRIRAFGNRVINEKVASQDVSEEFSDVEAQLRTLRVSHATYLDLLRKATTIEDILKIQARVGEIETQINRLEGRRTFLSRRSELATITIQLTLAPTPTATITMTPTTTPTSTPTTTPTVTPESVWDPGASAQTSWDASFRLLKLVQRILQFTVDAVVRVVVFFWWMIPIVVIGFVIWRVRRNRDQPPGSPPESTEETPRPLE